MTPLPCMWSLFYFGSLWLELGSQAASVGQNEGWAREKKQGGKEGVGKTHVRG